MSAIKTMGVRFSVFSKKLIPCYLITGVFLLIGFLGLSFELWIRILLVTVFSCIYIVTVWKWVLDPAETSFVVSLVKTVTDPVRLFALRLSKGFG